MASIMVFQYNIKDSSCRKNLLTAIQNPEVVDANLTKKLLLIALQALIPHRPFPKLRISPLGLVPKKREGEYH